MNNERGITLIALIVTIIMLLILSGITINLTLGQDGIINKAQQVKEKHSEASVKEKVSIILSDYMVDKHLNKKKLLDYLNEQKELGKIDSVKDNNDGTYTIQIDGYDVTIEESDLSIIELSQSGASPKISNIQITLEDGITKPDDYSVDLGTKLKIDFEATIEGGTITSIEPSVPYTTTGMELEKEFIIKGNINGRTYEKTINVSLKDKYKLQTPEINLSYNEWTKDNIKVSVNWLNNNENLKREISLDGGTTYTEYVGPVEVTSNTIIKAKISNGTMEVIGELEVNKIDKLTPNNFTPEISDLDSSTEFTIKANTTDKDATEEYSKSEIKGYIYYVLKDKTIVSKSELINSTTYKASGLTVGESYDIYVEAYDNAGNMTKSETINYTKLEVYKWARYAADITITYDYTTSYYGTVTFEQSDGSFFYYAHKYMPNMDKTTGKWTLPQENKPETTSAKGISGYYIYKKQVTNVMYQIISAECVENEYLGGADLKIDANIIKSYNVTKYTKTGDVLNYVTSNNPNQYPDNDGLGSFWFEKVN